MQQKIVPIEGMHCASCEILVKEKLEEIPEVMKAEVSLKSKSAILTVKQFPTEKSIVEAVASAGYSVGYEEKTLISHDKRVYRDVTIGALLVTILTIIFSQSNLKILANLTTDNSNLGVTALVIGLTAGISTCMALVGGLVLGISTKHAERYPSATRLQRFRPHIFFNIGRIVGFTLLGALVGGLGAFFSLSGSLLGWLMIIVSLVMLVLGLNLTELFPRLEKLTLPSKLASKLGLKTKDQREYSWYGSILTGALTFFLPCGFTQAMQLLAVSSGTPMAGALIMGMFALGTTPGLLGIGGLAAVIKGRFAKSFFRIVGVAVIALALVNFANAFTLANIRLPDFGAMYKPKPLVISNDTKRLDTVFRPSSNPEDITPSSFTTKVGQKTALVVDTKADGQGCMSTIMIPGLYDKPIFLRGGKQLVLEFTPKVPGIYKITCAMGVPRGTITVEES